MTSDAQHAGRRSRLVLAVLFFAALAVFAWRCVRTDMIYTAFGVFLEYPAFALDKTMVAHYFSQPAGPIACLAALLGQFYYYPVAGAAILTSVAVILSLAMRGLIKTASGRPCCPLPLMILPALALVAIANRCQFALQGPLAVALSMLASLLYRRVKLVTAKGRISLFIVMFALLYYLTGAAAFVFAIIIALDMAIRRTQPFGGAPLIILAGIICWCLAVGLHHLTPKEAFTLNTPFDAPSAMVADRIAMLLLVSIYLIPPVLFAAAAVRGELARDKSAVQAPTANKNKPGILTRLRIARLLEPALVIALVAATAFASAAPDKRNLFEALYHMQARRWSNVLTCVSRIPLGGYDFYANHMADRALYHLGELPDRMCSLPQSRHALLLATTNIEENPAKFALLSETCMDLGDLNLAQKNAYELLESQGPCPFNLENLALIHLAKDQSRTARLLLKALQKDVIHRRHATQMLAQLDRDPTMADDPRVRRMRSCRIKEDSCIGAVAEDELCTAPLKANPSNRMAFEYLMSFYLLTKQLDKFAAVAPLLPRLGYRTIGSNYQEAILIYSSMTRKQVQIAPLTISPETMDRYRRFTTRYKSLGANPRMAFGPMSDEFGDSYFFYYIFNACGAGRN